MIIRPARLADMEKIAATHKASIEAICSKHYDAPSIAGWTEVIKPEIYESAIRDKVVIIAEENAEILGFGILDAKRKEIGAVYLHPKAQGAGLGRQLLAKLESIATTSNIDQLTLCSTINALGFYQHHGYISTGIATHELPNGVRLECIRMQKML